MYDPEQEDIVPGGAKGEGIRILSWSIRFRLLFGQESVHLTQVIEDKYP